MESNGWFNGETYSVAREIIQTRELAEKAKLYKSRVSHSYATYADFLRFAGLVNESTRDGVAFQDLRVNDFQIVEGVIFN